MADTFTIERSGVVAGEPDQAFDLISDFHAWPRWSPWEDLDPNLQRTYSGAESGVGAAYSWTGNKKAGAGNMHITEADRPGRVVLDLAFVKPFKSQSTQTFTITPEGSGSKVVWTMVGSRPLFMKVFGFLFNLDKQVGGDFEKGLARMDEALQGRR